MSKPGSVFGTVTECLPNLLYKVAIYEKATGMDAEYICYLAGKLKINKIRILVGDQVEVILDPYGGKSTNRIVFRK